jgi:hypothetical protein
MINIQVVPKHSAILPAYNSIGIHANHMDMTKFSNSEDNGYRSVSTEILRWVRDIIKSSDQSQLLPWQVHYPNEEAEPGQGNYPAEGESNWGQKQFPLPPPQQYYYLKNSSAQAASPIQHTSRQHEGYSEQTSSDPRAQQSTSIPSLNIHNQRTFNGGKTVQGNYIASERDLTINF